MAGACVTLGLGIAKASFVLCSAAYNTRLDICLDLKKKRKTVYAVPLSMT